jgi:hypothetical protein
MPLKPSPSLHHDNSSLSSRPSEAQVNAVYGYCHNFSEYYQHFIMACYRIAPTANLSELTVVDSRSELEEVIRMVKEEGYVFLDTISDFAASYKGEISWIVVGFNNRGYLVDGMALRSEVPAFKSILENAGIIKFTYRQCILLEDAKREWGAFGINFFDFELFEKSIGVNKHLKIFPSHICERPISA